MNLVVPTLEGDAEVRLVKWMRRVGEAVKASEIVAELETDKANFDLASPIAGTLIEQRVAAGTVVTRGQVVGHVSPGPWAR